MIALMYHLFFLWLGKICSSRRVIIKNNSGMKIIQAIEVAFIKRKFSVNSRMNLRRRICIVIDKADMRK